MAVAGAGAGAEIMDQGGAGAENEKIRLRNIVKSFTPRVEYLDPSWLTWHKLHARRICTFFIQTIFSFYFYLRLL